MAQKEKAVGAFGVGKWLAASLAGNVFLLGIVLGAHLFRPPFPPGPPPRPPLKMMVAEASGKLSPEGLKKLEAFADEFERDFRKSMTSMDAQRDNIRAALLREPFDVAAFSRALDELNAQFAQGRANTNRRFAEVVESLSPSDRKQLSTVRFP